MDRRHSPDELERFIAATCEPVEMFGVPISDLVARFNRWSGNPSRMHARRMTVMLRKQGYQVMVVRYGEHVRRSLVGYALRDVRVAV